MVYLLDIKQRLGLLGQPFSDIVVENSQYRGIMVERYNHSQYSNLLTNAIFENLELRGTGGPNAKTSGLGYAAFDINTSGVHIDGAIIEDNIAVGLKGIYDRLFYQNRKCYFFKQWTNIFFCSN